MIEQLCAEAAISLRRHPGDNRKVHGYIADLLTHAVKISLPENGEIYRSNFRGGVMPTEDEAASVVLPSPITAYEYRYNYKSTGTRENGLSEFNCSRRITLVLDPLEVSKEEDIPENMTKAIQMISIFRIDKTKQWTTTPFVMTIAFPAVFKAHKNPYRWAVNCNLINMDTNERVNTNDHKLAGVAGDFHSDITAFIQCCHSLRAGAALKESVDYNKSKRRKLERRGKTGFSYHVLELPGEASQRPNNSTKFEYQGLTRRHLRRAHIRKLQSGKFTFVRHCLVGNEERGFVEKDYAVKSTKEGIN